MNEKELLLALGWPEDKLSCAGVCRSAGQTPNKSVLTSTVTRGGKIQAELHKIMRDGSERKELIVSIQAVPAAGGALAGAECAVGESREKASFDDAVSIFQSLTRNLPQASFSPEHPIRFSPKPKA